MRRRHIPESVNAHPNVTPLIDVVMVMIVFFMLVAKIGVDTGADPNISIPPSIQGLEIQNLGNSLVLNVSAGSVDYPTVTAMVEGVREELRIVDPTTKQKPLVNSLRRLRFGKDLAQGGSDDNADNPEFRVIIRADQDLDYRYLVRVLEACAEAGVNELAYNTARAQQEVIQ